MTLPECTGAKFAKYEQLLNDAEGRPEFWDVVVITARDDSQRIIYDYQIDQKKKRREIPSFVRYVVLSDPPGVKVGSGGSTLHCLEYLLNIFGHDSLRKWKILIIHAGGFSQRLPNQSVLGKVFLTLPCGKHHMQMLDALLMMYIDIPERMNYGVFIAASDVIFIFNEKGNWDFKGPGFTAITHPASLELAKNHGVFILEDMTGPWQKYISDPSSPAMISTAKRFLHKQTAEVLKDKGALIPDSDLVYVDLAFYFDVPTALKLIQFYADLKPLKCEVDAYADFLQPLGAAASADYYKESLYPERAIVQEKLFGILNGTLLNVVIFHEAQFNHLGTISEFLHHICENTTLRDAYEFVNCYGSQCSSGESLSYRIMHSIIGERLCIEPCSVIEYCIVEDIVSVGRNCLLSNLHVPRNAVIPSYTFFHTMALQVQDDVLYTTCVFGVNDNLKKTLPTRCALELEFLHTSLGSVIGTAEYSTSDLWPENGDCNLWTAKLFPLCSTRKESCEAALSIITAVKEKRLIFLLSEYTQVLSMEDVMVLKSGMSMLEFQSRLRQ